MVDEARSITVTIMGREYQIACPPEEHERLTECAEYLNGRMNAIRKRGRSMGIERIAIMAQDGLARALRPVHGPTDGDILFVIATGQETPAPLDPLSLTRLGLVAADCVARAIARGVFEATKNAA